ncbi:MAG: FAD-dependent oxidoreductase, partial [Actinomycetota bacterium]|nr:FAD-dependent oxidoreductase [Actinomycetota bacterium]
NVRGGAQPERRSGEHRTQRSPASTGPKDLRRAPHRELSGEHRTPVISAAGKRVVVIGGGDTGMDCLSSANREGAESVLMLDVYGTVPEGGRYADTPWPQAPRRTETTYALDEGGERRFGTQVTLLEGEGRRLARAHARQVEGSSSRDLQPVPGSEFMEEAELCLVAIGFTHPAHDGLISDLGLDLDARGNVRAKAFATSRDGVYAAGDARVGQSLIVNAIADGRRAARMVDRRLREFAAAPEGAAA